MLDRLPAILKSAWIPATAGIGERISGTGYVVVWLGVDVCGWCGCGWLLGVVATSSMGT